MKKLSFVFNLTRSGLFIGNLALFVVAILSLTSRAAAQNSDTIPPQVSDFSLSSSLIDTTGEAQTITVALRVIDNDKGVNMVAVRFRSASGNQFVNAFITAQQRVSGDNKDGIYNAVVTFPQYSKAGMWNVLEIEARDEANNYKTFNTPEIASLGYATELQVISNNEDVVAPEISNLSFDSAAIDTTNGSQTVNVTVRATDALSGVRSLIVYFYMPSVNYLIAAELNSQQIVSGNNKDVVYTGTVTFAPGTDSGMWRIGMSASDALGNQKTFSADELAALGFATELQVVAKTPSPQPTQKSRKRARIF